MILPINRVCGADCIFCGKFVSLRDDDGQYYIIKDGRKIVAARRFHKDCYFKNAKESKRRRTK